MRKRRNDTPGEGKLTNKHRAEGHRPAYLHWSRFVKSQKETLLCQEALVCISGALTSQ